MKNKKARGFNKLLGETIKVINTSAINEVIIVCESGKTYSLTAEDQHYGIPILQLKKEKKP